MGFFDDINWWNTHLTEAEGEAATKAIQDKKLSTGALSKEFEKKFRDSLKNLD